MSKSSPSGPSQRQLRVGEQIRHILAEAMQRGHFHDENLLDASHITITEVRVSPDLRNATAYVVALLGGRDITQILPALNAHAHFFQKEIGRQSNLKFTPRVYFKTDETFEEADKIERLLREIRNPDGTEK
ncbi:MAG: 30S ribosome-binding factor RbfA [Alphaproteobacteria bacterium]|nr:30S ribosome-binding factor RbfA [Alphaproteobacteria bacterium]